VNSLEVKYGGDLHRLILDAVRKRKEFSDKKMVDFRKQWDDADDSMRAYIHAREIDKVRKNKKTFDGNLDYVTLEVPYVYAIIMTAHTYYCNVMLSRQPVFQFTGRHGETQDSIMAVEAVMDYQMKVGNLLPPMYNWLYDWAKYSIGVIGEYWDEEVKTICKYQKVPNTIMGIPVGGSRVQKTEEILKGYVGNKLYNVRPYDFYPDPRVPVWKFQDGEFVIRYCSESYSDIVSLEQNYPGYYINLRELAKTMQTRSSDHQQGSPRVQLPFRPGEAEGMGAPGPGFLNVDEAHIKLIPSVWGLSDSKRKEIWNFQVAEKEVVIRAAPLGLYHDRFPYSVLEGNFGSDEFAKFGVLEVIRPLTDVLTWLFNSHFYNVRRVLNNQIVFDPSKVTMKDLTKSGQRLIRLKPRAYGTNPSDAIHQLQMVDVTRSHLSDAQYVEQMIQRVSSVVDTVMGVQDQGSRRSATESRITTGWSTSRLKTPVEYNSALAFDPLSSRMLSNTRQFLDQERKYLIAGNTLEQAGRFVDVSPALIAGDYDFVPVDGTAPIDRMAQANFWKELLVQMARIPQFAMQWDIGGMVAHAMKLQGERNIDRFRINVAQPGTNLQNEAGKGNVVPIGGQGGGGTRGGNATGTSGGTI